MRLHCCFPLGLDASADIEDGDVIGISCIDGHAVLSLNGAIVEQANDMLFRVVASEKIRIPISDWPDQARELAAEIIALWQNMQHAGEKVKQLRKSARLMRRSDLGDLLGLSGQTVYRWENNQTFPTEKHSDDFRKLFGV